MGKVHKEPHAIVIQLDIRRLLWSYVTFVAPDGTQFHVQLSALVNRIAWGLIHARASHFIENFKVKSTQLDVEGDQVILCYLDEVGTLVALRIEPEQLELQVETGIRPV